MRATVFVAVSYGMVAGESFSLTESADTAEECLGKLETGLLKKINWKPSLIFRPADGMIFCGDMSSTVPIGVLYREGY